MGVRREHKTKGFMSQHLLYFGDDMGRGSHGVDFFWDASEVIEFLKSANMACSEIGGAGNIFSNRLKPIWDVQRTL